MLLFAPIQGYTEAFYRQAHHNTIGGVDEYYMPFMRIEKNELRSKDLRELTSPNPPNTTPQILVKSPDELKTLLAPIAKAGYSSVDLNFGCPFPKVTQHGYGAGILPSPQAIESVLSALSNYPQIAFSVKMRIGLNSTDELPPLLPLLNAAPLRHVTLHPRLGHQQYNGDIDMDSFRFFTAHSDHPVIFNGDIRTISDTAPYHDVMIGRGLLANPLLALEIRDGRPLPAPRRLELLLAFHKSLVTSLQDIEQPLQKLKTIWDYFLPNAEPHLRKKLLKSRTLDDYLALAPQVIESALNQ
ncbi:MAG: tRNA-dihydrouridine synthase family protein [Victivallales bacterium]|nr:tRNA-dihydrouridine synthase family protein [Victivallales bacterium]